MNQVLEKDEFRSGATTPSPPDPDTGAPSLRNNKTVTRPAPGSPAFAVQAIERRSNDPARAHNQARAEPSGKLASDASSSRNVGDVGKACSREEDAAKLPRKCRICSLAAENEVLLLTGNVVHFNCVRSFRDRLAITEKAVNTLRLELASFELPTSGDESVLKTIVVWLLGRLTSSELRTHAVRLENALSQAEALHKALAARAEKFFDVMLDFPPDWGARRNAVIDRDRQCAECGSTKYLQVHHVVPLSKGGSNRLNNLIALCAPCDKHKHGRRSLHGEKPLRENHSSSRGKRAVNLQM
jgi:hypothetical protein